MEGRGFRHCLSAPTAPTSRETRLSEALRFVEAAIALGGEQPEYQAMRTDLHARLGSETDTGDGSDPPRPAKSR